MLYVHGMGHFHPENIIDNAFLAELNIGTNDEWITSRTGIKTRHTVLPLDYIAATRNSDARAADAASLYSNAETSLLAAEMALDRAGLRPSDIGLVIAGSSSPRHSSPAEACLVAEQLGISCPAFDLNSACSTFAVQMRTLLQMRPEALPDYVLVVNADNMTRAANYAERRTSVLLGDCTTAAIVSATVKGRVRILEAFQETDASAWRKVVIPFAGHLEQDGQTVQSFAIRRTAWSIEHLAPRARPGFLFIGHQANLLMLEAAAARAGVGSSRHLYNVDRRGNCGAAGAPSVISEHWDEFPDGVELVVAVVGAGLTWAGLRVDFGEERAA